MVQGQVVQAAAAAVSPSGSLMLSPASDYQQSPSAHRAVRHPLEHCSRQPAAQMRRVQPAAWAAQERHQPHFGAHLQQQAGRLFLAATQVAAVAVRCTVLAGLR